MGNTQPNNNVSFRYLFDTVLKVNLGHNWNYAMEVVFGHDSATTLADGTTGPASWTGWCNYLLYNINDCWTFGGRYEYYEDLDGATVSDHFTDNPIPTSTLVGASRWQEVTLGLNWKPNLNVTCRSEVRWDWGDNTLAAGAKPFTNGTANGQFLWGNDIIIRF
jgi:hypothetical protein